MEEGLSGPVEAISPLERQREWVRYYSPKRIYEQLLQVHLLEDLPITRVLEIGPYLGLVTAMLENADYEVTTMDRQPPMFRRPQCPHLEMDLTAIEPEKLRGFDCIMCCATLEHIEWPQAKAALRSFRESGSPYVLISVPFQENEIFYQLYANRFTFEHRFALKKLRFLKEFSVDPDPYGHKWEVGYKGRSLKTYETMIRDSGFKILRRRFSYPSFAVFHMLEPASQKTG